MILTFDSYVNRRFWLAVRGRGSNVPRTVEAGRWRWGVAEHPRRKRDPAPGPLEARLGGVKTTYRANDGTGERLRRMEN